MSHLVIAPILLPAVLAGLILLVARGIVLQRLIALAGAAGFLALPLLLAGRGGAPVAYHLGN